MGPTQPLQETDLSWVEFLGVNSATGADHFQGCGNGGLPPSNGSEIREMRTSPLCGLQGCVQFSVDLE